ncbi:rhamnogalacturonan acetylesterase [Flaviaesturariibacter flavus]|uniref:Rhamnogalacturonan acetylesterase n=1 Tax=Flaviaesturariibacter flavus TaxID=2502780 RepID=A0A4V2NVN9_9BACT|nr:rhamnogalacturonan acetylesterase [Flaviaesturariibacter flavus]TCJ14222.1 rhamnogalacturonan acetylesterase [Flaviaesturariibacter flavus]
MKLRLTAILCLALLAFAHPPRRTKVYLVGDSTCANKEVRAYPETGWGMPFANFFDSTVEVDNRAKNGRSTRTFISEGLWQPVADNLQAGDYVFIQFGHNDESKEKTDRYTTPEQYTANILRFIAETRAKKAVPVLLTPVSRRKFDNDGNAVETHEEYAPLVRRIAQEQGIAFIDADEKTKALYQQFGPEYSKLLFLQLEKGEHPNYPDGKNDNTHFNELGARKVAQIILQGVRDLNLELAAHIRKPIQK